MRFLIGIITGAILTLLFATAMDAPTHPILDRTQGRAAEIWDRLISTTSDSLFAENAGTADPQAALPGALRNTPAAVDSPDEQAVTDAVLPVAARAPAAGLAAPRAVAEPPPAVIARPPVASKLAEIEPEGDRSPGTASLPMPENLAFDAEDAAEAPVWVPFHSLMSAEGFAARLTRELNHDFQVERQGAGTYQVVFEASDPAQRAALLAQISEITGQ